MYLLALNSGGQVTIDVQQLLLGLLIIVGVVLAVVLIIVLIKAIGTLTKVNRLIDDLSSPLKETTAELPAVAVNIRDILGNLVDLTDDVTVASPELLDAVIEALQSANAGVGSVSSLVVGLSNGITNVAQRFTSPTRRSSFVNAFASMAGSFTAAKANAKKKRKFRR